VNRTYIFRLCLRNTHDINLKYPSLPFGNNIKEVDIPSQTEFFYENKLVRTFPKNCKLQVINSTIIEFFTKLERSEKLKEI
jgi:hypothetical protein